MPHPEVSPPLPAAGKAVQDHQPIRLAVILQGGSPADEAMYTLLHHRLRNQLRRRYEVYRRRLNDGFDDILTDYFFYLRDGRDDISTTPYASLRAIRDPQAFEAWLLNTFRNYLTVRAEQEDSSAAVTSQQLDARAPLQPASSPLTDEDKLAAASTIIAYAHQSFLPRDRFIFLRMLLSLLNRQQALPNDAIAEALAMNPVAYRVSVHRIKSNLAKFRLRLLRGEALPLDEPHRTMACRINDDFLHLYPILFSYYCQALDSLDAADAVKRLRQKQLESTRNVLHEPEAHYSLALGIPAFWKMLSRLCETVGK